MPEDTTKKIRFSPFLIISLALNFGLLASLIFVATTDRSRTGIEETHVLTKDKPLPKPVVEVLNTDLSASFDTLKEALESDERIDEHFLRRDVALACLTSFHNFNIERALGGVPYDVRNYSFSNPSGNERITITFVAGLSEDHFARIRHFVKTEAWPLTAKGLFLELKSGTFDGKVKEAFICTDTFRKMKKIMDRASLPLSDDHLVKLLTQGSWDHILRLSRVGSVEEAPEVALSLLQHLVGERSQVAAALLVSYAPGAILRSGKNEFLSHVIELLEPADPKSMTFLQQILDGIRPQYLKEKAEQKILLHASLHKADKQEKGTLTAEISYTVRPGDSLWKIAHKHNIKVLDLCKRNKLRKDTMLRVGQKLHIPLH